MSKTLRGLQALLLVVLPVPTFWADERSNPQPTATQPAENQEGALRLPPISDSERLPIEGLPPPVILTPEERVQGCLQLAGVQRLDCLGNESLHRMSGEPCDQDPSGQCRKIVGNFLMQRCQGLDSDDKKGACLLAVATEFPDPAICPDSIDPVACFSLVAMETKDVSVIMENFPSGQQRDMILATHAAVAYDPAAIDLIEDNYIHDMGHIYVMAPRAIGMDEYLPADYCNGLRGDYSDPDEDPASSRQLCDGWLPVLQAYHTSMAVAETDQEEERVLEDFTNLVKDLQEHPEMLAPELEADAWNDQAAEAGADAALREAAIAADEAPPEAPTNDDQSSGSSGVLQAEETNLEAPDAELESPCEPGDCEDFRNPLLELANELRRRAPQK